MPSTPEESNTTTATPTVTISPEAKSPLAKTTITELTPTQLYIEGTVITNETQLTLQEHKLQELISKQITLAYDGYNSMNLVAILISLGAMVISLTTISNPNLVMYAYSTACLILVASIGFALYERNKQKQNQSSIQHNIDKTLNAIEHYSCQEKPPKLQKIDKPQEIVE